MAKTNILRVIATIITLTFTQFTYAQDQATIQESESSAFKGALYSVWTKLRSFNPRVRTQQVTGNQVIATAGIRGSQGTETLFTPYWKDDKTSDTDFLAEVDAILAAQNLADDGKLSEAELAYGDFIKNYPDSDLLPNAEFAKAMTQAAAGKSQDAAQAMRAFAKKHENHPLAQDAELVANSL